MVFCTNCGSQVADGLKFCSECGATVNAQGAATATASKNTDLMAPLKNISKHTQTLALAIVLSALSLVLLMSSLVSVETDMGAMLGFRGDAVNTRYSIMSARGSFSTVLSTVQEGMDAEVERFIDRRDPTRSELREFRSDLRDEYNETMGPVITASRFYGAMSIFVIISIIGILLFLYLVTVKHPMATLVGLASTGFATLTTIITIIGTTRVQATFADNRDWRDVFSVSNSFWVIPTLIVCAAALFFVFSLKKSEPAEK